VVTFSVWILSYTVSTSVGIQLLHVAILRKFMNLITPTH